MAAVIIPQWRTPRSEQGPPANPYTVPLALTLVLVAVFLLDHACTLLCACRERSTQVISCCTLRLRWFLALTEVIWETFASRFVCWFVDVCDCVAAGRAVWGKLSQGWKSFAVRCGLGLRMANCDLLGFLRFL